MMLAEKSVKQWLSEMKAAGFYGKYEARSGDLVIKGEIPRNIEIENRVIAEGRAEAERLAIKQEIISYVKKSKR